MTVETQQRESSGADLLRFATAGSVDDGKSTLIGRLLIDSRHVCDDHLAALARDSERRGMSGGQVEFALLLDGLRAEREQNITIDVAYRYFSTTQRSFIIADTPGHEQYTRNMATGASTADLAVILIDARNGITTQTRRHSFIMSLLGVRHIVVAVNKMDLVEYDRTVFEDIQREYLDFSAKLQFADIRFLPISALRGDNVVTRSGQMPWYNGLPLLRHLETVQVTGDRNLVDLRFPVQYVLRANQDFRGYAGTVASGTIRPGIEVMSLPSGRTSRVRSVRTADGELDEAYPPLAVSVELEDELDISRGDMLVHPNNLPSVTSTLEAMIVWMADQSLRPGREYLVKHTTALVRGTVTGLRYRVDVNTMHREAAGSLGLNEIGRVAISLVRPVFADSYEKNRATGGFILIDPATNATVGAGMIVDRRPSDLVLTSPQSVHAEPTVHLHKSPVTAEERADRLGQKPATIWLTGLPKSGKSTIAYTLERRLFDMGVTAHVLDGENLRADLSNDLGFSADDRLENVRRAASVARINNDLGLITIAAFVSPYMAIRAGARDIIGEGRYIEVFVKASLEICEARDKDSIYERARRGEIQGFTGISAPYEPPEHPDIVVDSERLTVSEAVDTIVRTLIARGIIGETGERGE